MLIYARAFQTESEIYATVLLYWYFSEKLRKFCRIHTYLIEHHSLMIFKRIKPSEYRAKSVKNKAEGPLGLRPPASNHKTHVNEYCAKLVIISIYAKKREIL